MFYEVAKPDNHDCSFCRKITISNFWWDIVQNEKSSNVWILSNKFQHIYCRSMKSSLNSTALQCVQNISLKITFCGRSMHSLLFAWGHLPSPQSSHVNSSSRRSYGWHSWQCQQQLSPWKKRRVSKHVSREC